MDDFDVEQIALTAVPVGAHEGPEPPEPPAPNRVQFPPLNEAERAQFHFLRAALSRENDTMRVKVMRVQYEGKPRAVITVLEDKGDMQVATPLALFLDEELFEAIMPSPSEVPNS